MIGAPNTPSIAELTTTIAWTVSTMARKMTTTEHTDPRAGEFGGRHAISGFLFQILRSVQLGLRMSVKLVGAPSDEPSMELVLEPRGGGDHQIHQAQRQIFEQMKTRAAHLKWSTREVASKVIPNLLREVSLGFDQTFRMVTNNEAGVGELRRFLGAFSDPGDGATFKWGKDLLSAKDFAARIAHVAGVDPEDARFQRFIANFSIEVIDTSDAEQEIDCLIEPLLAPGQRAEDKREELISRLLKDASAGRVLDSADLLALIHPEAAHRLAHARTLGPELRARIEADCRALGYDGSTQARLAPPEASSPLTIFSGESGQGKTWSLCQSALERSERGELVLVARSPIDMKGLIGLLNDRLWLGAYSTPVAPRNMAQRLADHWRGADGFWLTIYIDDLQSRALAEEIAALDWQQHGIRLIISAQPRTTEVLMRDSSSARVERIGNFSSAELRNYLRLHGREDPLDSMPDDIFELLLKPIHARIFTEIPAREGWTGVTEYELFQAYWTFATRRARAQRDHPSDREGLVSLARSLLGDRPRYPFLARDVRAAGLDDEALRRLEAVGLLRWVNDDHLVFATDRMLNWAVAESLSARIVDEDWTPAQAEAELHRLGEIVTVDDEPVGRRLGYVNLDTIWLLTHRSRPHFLADLILAEVIRLPQEWRGDPMWGNLASVGSSLLPALETLALRKYDEERDYDIPWHIPLAIGAIGGHDREAIIPSVERLIGSERASGVTAALKVARRVSLPELLDSLWRVHLERERQLEVVEATEERNNWSDHFSRRQLSSQAVRTALRGGHDWLDCRIVSSSDPYELNLLLWMLTDQCIDDDRARGIWLRRRDHLLSHLDHDSRAMINALGHFADADNRAWLNEVDLGSDDHMSARVLRSRARIDPATALQQLRDRDEEYGWSAANWWLPELARADPAGLSDAIRENAAKSDHPLTDVVLFYGHFPELMDRQTLEWVLDEFAVALETLNDESTGETDSRLGRLGHPLRFLISLTEPWQFDCLAARAGTSLERELVRLAAPRRGRVGRLRDTEGRELERLLAMIGGDGFDALVLAAIERRDPFAREDGYAAAHWTESLEVTETLKKADPGAEPDSYRQVIRMQALAIHQCDAELEAMVRANSPIYLNAATMRSAEGRPIDALRRRVDALLATGDAEELKVATNLTGFLRGPKDARRLLPAFLSGDTPEPVRRSMIGTFRVLNFYEPSMLPVVRELMGSRIDKDGQFAASYLAGVGDETARVAVVAWLQNLDFGTWSTSHDAFLRPLLQHEDSRHGVVDFLRRSRAGGHLLISSHYLHILADEGDVQAQEELARSAYREPKFGSQSTTGGIMHLRQRESDEAFFAARRYLIRKEAQDAIVLLLQIDMERAIPLLIAKYRSAKPSIQCEIARRLRLYLPGERLRVLLMSMAKTGSQADKMIAVELAGWMPPSLHLDWLDQFADQGTPRLREAARDALRSRAREAAAIEHLRVMRTCSKPSRWARLQTIFDCVDPDFLWAADDPASLSEFLDANPPEFKVEARQLVKSRSKKLDDEARKADRED